MKLKLNWYNLDCIYRGERFGHEPYKAIAALSYIKNGKIKLMYPGTLRRITKKL